jgi:DNA-directed RNA polymerase alpha subunit
MTADGSTTDVIVKKNDTPMTNEMLADRVGLLPINVPNPLDWKNDVYTFTLKMTGDKHHTTSVTSSNFIITKKTNGYVDSTSESEKEEESKDEIIPTHLFFPPNPKTGQTCLIAVLQPVPSGSPQQEIEIVAKATSGTGREHATFCPVSQCSYEYALDNDPQRIEQMMHKWITTSKNVKQIDKASAEYAVFKKEFETMERKRCFLTNANNEPYAYDFTIETVGVLPVQYIVSQACEAGQNICSKYMTIDKGPIPSEITISHCDGNVIGYDFLIKGHDYTLGKLIQTWLVEKHIEGNEVPKITFAGCSIPHPLRDELLLRIGVSDGKESTARLAFAKASEGCALLFQKLHNAWMNATTLKPTQLAPPKIKRKLASQAKLTK